MKSNLGSGLPHPEDFAVAVEEDGPAGEFEDPWEGLTQEERAELEHANGVDKELDVEHVDTLAIEPGAAAASPGCATVLHDWHWGQRRVHVINHCTYNIRVRAVWHRSGDSGCNTLRPSYYFVHYANPLASFGGVHFC